MTRRWAAMAAMVSACFDSTHRPSGELRLSLVVTVPLGERDSLGSTMLPRSGTRRHPGFSGL